MPCRRPSSPAATGKRCVKCACRTQSPTAFSKTACYPPGTRPLVEAMKTLGAIPGRSSFIQYAARADSEDAALLFQEMAELLADCHRSIAPIQRLEIYQNVPVAYTAPGSAVILLPIDRLLWTERTSGIATGLAQTLPNLQPVRHIEVWMTGDASDRTRAALQQLGITLVEHAGQRLPLLD
jgi:hypothetical protein